MRFQVGEMAKFVVARVPKSLPLVGRVCEIKAVGIEKTPDGYPYEHIVTFGDSPKTYGVLDWQLQKLNPPEEPVEMIRHREAVE